MVLQVINDLVFDQSYENLGRENRKTQHCWTSTWINRCFSASIWSIVRLIIFQKPDLMKSSQFWLFGNTFSTRKPRIVWKLMVRKFPCFFSGTVKNSMLFFDTFSFARMHLFLFLSLHWIYNIWHDLIKSPHSAVFDGFILLLHLIKLV